MSQHVPRKKKKKTFYTARYVKAKSSVLNFILITPTFWTRHVLRRDSFFKNAFDVTGVRSLSRVDAAYRMRRGSVVVAVAVTIDNVADREGLSEVCKTCPQTGVCAQLRF